MLKKTLFALAFVGQVAHAQNLELWGMTSSGGQNNSGTIFKTDLEGNNLSTQFNFLKSGSEVIGPLCQANDGKYYGYTSAGGGFDFGTIYAYDPVLKLSEIVFNFDGVNSGRQPYTKMTLGTDGLLYGMAVFGGANDLGTLFSFDPSTAAFTKHVDFDGMNGSSGLGNLVLADNGKFYGITKEGGSFSLGVLFEFDPVTKSCVAKHNFAQSQAFGIGLSEFLTLANNGKLYGNTLTAGSKGGGTIFEYDLTNETVTVVYEIDKVSEAEYLVGPYVETSPNVFFGSSAYGGSNNTGVLFSFDVVSQTFQKITDLTGAANGQRGEENGLSLGSNGKVYGTTVSGGANNKGVFYEYNPLTQAVTTKYEFTLSGPSHGYFLEHQPNKFYCVFRLGSAAIYNYNLDSLSFENLSFINQGVSGSHPEGDLVQHLNGKIYGLTKVGGINNYGTAFSFDPNTNEHVKIEDFGYAINGYLPSGSLIRGKNDKLYGLCRQTTSSFTPFGSLFSVDPSVPSIQDEVSFTGTEKGVAPYGSLVLSPSNGSMYGLTSKGGLNDMGVIFEFDPYNQTYVNLFDFDGTGTGKTPLSSLVFGFNNALFGMTQFGGANDLGVLFQFNLGTNTFDKLYDFDGTNGSMPTGDLYLASNGKLYGMTPYGGANDNGVIFEYDIMNSTYTKIFDFNAQTGGANPTGSLIETIPGKLYGLTQNGGTMQSGVLFEYNFMTNTYTTKFNFDNLITGKAPLGSLMLYDPKLGLVEKQTLKSFGLSISPNPSSKTATIHLEQAFKETHFIEVRNAAGLVVLKQTLPANTDELMLSMEHLVAGIYFVHLKDGKSSRGVYKWVKM